MSESQKSTCRVFSPEIAELMEWIEEAVEYVNKESRSPSLEAEGRRLLRRSGWEWESE